jgi:hypothetical protein
MLPLLGPSGTRIWDRFGSCLRNHSEDSSVDVWEPPLTGWGRRGPRNDVDTYRSTTYRVPAHGDCLLRNEFVPIAPFGAMKWVYIFGMLVSLLMAALIFLQFPIIKVTTQTAMNNIETRYLASPLSDSNMSDYIANSRSILGNENETRMALNNARHFGLGVCLVLFIQSIAGLVLVTRRKTAEECDRARRTGS